MHRDTSPGISFPELVNQQAMTLQFLLFSTCYLSSVLSAVVLPLDKSREFATTHVGRAFSA